VEQPAGTNLTDGTGVTGFGSVTTGTTGTPLTFTIRNAGTANLTGISITRDGANAADFPLDTVGMATTLSPGATTTFAVSFAPAAAGPRSATLHIASNDPDENPFEIALAGTGLSSAPQPDIAVEQPAGNPVASGGARSFGTVAMPKKPSLTFTIRNTGHANLGSLGVQVSGPNAAEFHVTASLSAPIKPGKSKTFKVQFAPVSAGAKQALLRIASNDPDENPYEITLTGTALARRDAAEARVTAGKSGETVRQTADAAILGAAADGAPDTALAAGAATATAVHAAGIQLAGTTWSLKATSLASLPGTGAEDGQGLLRLTLHADGSLYVEDDSGAGLWGTWSGDAASGLSAQVFPQSVEDFLQTVLGADPGGVGIGVDSAELDLQVGKGPVGPEMDATLGFTAWLPVADPETGATVERELTYEVTASGPQD